MLKFFNILGVTFWKFFNQYYRLLQILASASGPFGSQSQSQICLWDMQAMACKKVLYHHDYDVVCLAYSRDDRFLISVGK